MKRNILFLISLFIGITAQLQTFPEEDPEKFYKELEKQLNRSNRSATKPVTDEFEDVFLEEMTRSQQQIIIEKSNLFRDELRFRFYPDLADYISAILYLHKSEELNMSFNEWHEIIGKMDNDRRKKRQLTDFISASSNLFKDNTLSSNRSGSVVWKSKSPAWKMTFDEEPVVTVEDPTGLVCYSKGDSILIRNTKGRLRLAEQKWEGSGGKVTWERVGFDSEEVYAELQDYSVDMSRAEYEADSAVFYNSFYFDEPLLGSFEDKVFPNPDKDRQSYPRFKSYSTRLPINNIIENVDYDGGFAQQAGKFLGRGTGDDLARLIIRREGKPFMIVEASSFLIKLNREMPEDEEESRKSRRNKEKKRTQKSSIVSNKARITMLLEEDTISHPGLKFTLLTDDRTARLVREPKGMSSTPYFNSFHQVEMEFELMRWEIDEPTIEFTTQISDKNAKFTSNNFFKERLFDQLSGGGTRLPLVEIRKCTKTNESQELTLYEMCDCMKLPPDQVEPMMLRYTIRGYVDYNSDKKMIKVFDKVHHHVKAKSKIADYDNIVIRSKVPGSSSQPSASLNLLNYDLSINGVSSVLLSDSNRVQIVPSEGKLVLKKNRDMNFSGFVSAGKSEYYGKEFSFSYDDFQIEMPVIDSLQLWADSRKKDKRGNKYEARVRTLIEDLRGDVKIDKPGNKSGLERYPSYPIFTSERESYAYYDAPNIQDGAYDRDKFYFQLEPFTLDSLNRIENEDYAFKGTFSSAGIFEDLEETLTLQPDYSLGFDRKTSPQGLQAYGGKGVFKQDLNLSNKGLKGDGAIEYITSRAESKDFTFYPDSVKGVTQKFYVESQKAPVEYPDVNADSTRLTWLPYKDELTTSSIENRAPISMYGGRSEHRGSLHYGPEALRGSGKNSFSGANLYSDNILFKLIELEADTSDFELQADVFGDVNFSSENLQAKVDFQDKKGEFISNTGRSLTEFGATLYQAYLDRFSWYMERDEIEYSAEGETAQRGAEEVEVEGAEFVSTHKDQDSLRFFAKAAVYNANDVIIEASEVEEIRVADASVRPGDGRVVVERDADMNTLDSATIVANTKTEYHKLTDATVNITGRWNYSGSGTYWYEDKNENIQKIYFNLIKANEKRETEASGTITREDEFTLSPQFNYKGDVFLEASERRLKFTGETKINHGCGNLPQEWISFESHIDPMDINIEIKDTTLNESRNAVATGMILPHDTGEVYGAFLSSPFSMNDLEVLPSRGFLVFDDPTKEYRISSFEKLNERALPGNYTALNTDACLLEGEGNMDLTFETGQLEIDPVGNYTFNTVNKNLSLRFMARLDFLLDDKLLDIITEEIKEDERAKPVDIDNRFYTTGMRNYIGVEETDEMLGRMKLGKRVRLPDKMEVPFFLNEVEMEWNESEDSYVSKGMLGIGSIDDEILNRYVEGGISFTHKRRGTDVMLYIKTGKNFYVFDYRASGGIMMVYTENEDFKEQMRDLKGKDRKLKATDDKKQFVYQMGSRRLRSAAMRRFEEIE